MIFNFFRKVVMASWPRIYRVFSPTVPKSAIRVFRPEQKRCTTNSCADSWWYHLEKCLLCPFRGHLRFWFFGIFWNPFPFFGLGSSEKVYTNCFRQPYCVCVSKSMWMFVLVEPSCRVCYVAVWFPQLCTWRRSQSDCEIISSALSLIAKYYCL